MFFERGRYISSGDARHSGHKKMQSVSAVSRWHVSCDITMCAMYGGKKKMPAMEVANPERHRAITCNADVCACQKSRDILNLPPAEGFAGALVLHCAAEFCRRVL